MILSTSGCCAATSASGGEIGCPPLAGDYMGGGCSSL